MGTRTRVATAAVAAWGIALAVNRSLRRVTGDSMRPVLAPGDVVVVVPASVRRLRRGDVVVVADPREPTRTVIKRIAALEEGLVDVRGDNPAASTDSRTFGRVTKEQIVSWVPLALGPPPRALHRSRQPPFSQ